MEDLGSSVLLGFRYIESIFLGSFREHGSIVRDEKVWRNFVYGGGRYCHPCIH